MVTFKKKDTLPTTLKNVILQTLKISKQENQILQLEKVSNICHELVFKNYLILKVKCYLKLVIL